MWFSIQYEGLVVFEVASALYNLTLMQATANVLQHTHIHPHVGTHSAHTLVHLLTHPHTHIHTQTKTVKDSTVKDAGSALLATVMLFVELLTASPTVEFPRGMIENK